MENSPVAARHNLLKPAVIIASWALAGSVVVGYHDISHDAPASTTCATLPASELAVAEKLADEPENPLIEQAHQSAGATKLRALEAAHPDLAAATLSTDIQTKGTAFKELSVFGKAYDNDHPDENDQINWNVDFVAANKNGVHDVNPLPYLDPLLKDFQNGAKLPYSVYEENASADLAQFGVKFDTATNDELRADVVDGASITHVPTQDDLETVTAKGNLIDIMRAFSRMPVEYVSLTGLRSIRFTANGAKPVNYAAYAETGGRHDTIVVNDSYRIGEFNISHELAHLLDAETCQGATAASNDPQIAAYSGAPYGTNSPKSGVLDQGNFGSDSTVQELENEEGHASDQEAVAIKSRIQQLKARLGFVSDYSRTNVLEDKAETGGHITSGDWSEVVNNGTPRVQGKFTVLLGRMAMLNKNLANYFSQISNKNSSEVQSLK
ncbi:MAG TPA: hypothetical protein VLG16_05170 [Candidatus Saccharimonadales bacterium]|nr:hypothetical protein [Candidatus Saccharimonadales bacterium]